MKLFTRVLVSLLLLCAAPVAAISANTPSPAVQKEFDGFIAKFRAAVKAQDSDGIASLSKLPFMGDQSISTAKQFRAKVYGPSFKPKTRTCLLSSKPVYDRDGENNENYFIFCGQDIFVFTKGPDGFLFTEIGAND